MDFLQRSAAGERDAFEKLYLERGNVLAKVGARARFDTRRGSEA